MDADEHPGAALAVEADHRLLAVPVLQQLLEHALDTAGRDRGSARLRRRDGRRTHQADRRRAQRPGLARVAPPARARGSSRACSTGGASRSRSRSPSASCGRALTGSAGLHSILDVEIDGTGCRARVDPQGLPGGQGSRRRHARRPAGGPPRPADHRVGHDPPASAARFDRACARAASLAQPLRELSVEALPLEIPEHFDLDVSRLAIGDTLRVSDIQMPEGVTVLDDPETVVATRRRAVRASSRPKRPRRQPRAPRARARRPRARPPPRASGGEAGGEQLSPSAALAAPSGLLARPARRRARQSGPRVRAQPPQRRLPRRRRARAPPRRHVALEVLRAARRDPPRRPQGRAAQARDVHERVGPRRPARRALLQGRAGRRARRPRRRRLRPRPASS